MIIGIVVAIVAVVLIAFLFMGGGDDSESDLGDVGAGDGGAAGATGSEEEIPVNDSGEGVYINESLDDQLDEEIDELFGEGLPTIQWNQDMGEDCITENVCLDKKLKDSLFNSVNEHSHDRDVSPVDTEWSQSSCESATDFVVFYQAANEKYGDNLIPGVSYCMHLITDDLYFDMEFLTWGKGIYSYTRTPYNP